MYVIALVFLLFCHYNFYYVGGVIYMLKKFDMKN